MEDKQTVVTSKTIRRLHPRFIMLGVAALCIIASIIALVKGYAYVGIKEPKQKVQLTYQVCGNDIIQKYNAFYFPLNNQDRKAMTTMVKDITASSGYADDPTCQAILFSAASENDDINGMQKALSALEKLSSENKNVDSNLRNAYSIDTMRMSVQETINEKNVGSGH